jgi:hypothetical protein
MCYMPASTNSPTHSLDPKQRRRARRLAERMHESSRESSRERDLTVPAGLEDDRVLPIPVAAVVSGTSTPTLRREIKAGRGPKVTWVSARRCGIRVRHLREWLDQCAGVA